MEHLNATDVLSKVKAAEVREYEFTPEGQTTPIKYKRLVLVVESNTEDFEVTMTMSKDQITLLQMADSVN